MILTYADENHDLGLRQAQHMLEAWMVNRPCNWKCTGYGSKEPGMILKCTWFNKMMENNGSETVLVQENLFMLFNYIVSLNKLSHRLLNQTVSLFK